MARTWFTSDTHFGHKNIIRLCDRPFGSVEEMDEALVKNWNCVIDPEDTVYHLGDVSFHTPGRTREIMYKLNGYKILIIGNHDEEQRLLKVLCDTFNEVHKSLTLNINMKPWILRHSPGYNVPGESVQICGHVHNNWAQKRWHTKRVDVINVGVDVRNFRPVKLEEIQELLTKPLYINQVKGA